MSLRQPTFNLRCPGWQTGWVECRCLQRFSSSEAALRHLQPPHFYRLCSWVSTASKKAISTGELGFEQSSRWRRAWRPALVRDSGEEESWFCDAHIEFAPECTNLNLALVALVSRYFQDVLWLRQSARTCSWSVRRTPMKLSVLPNLKTLRDQRMAPSVTVNSIIIRPSPSPSRKRQKLPLQV
jgi:hypothetical protein